MSNLKRIRELTAQNKEISAPKPKLQAVATEPPKDVIRVFYKCGHSLPMNSFSNSNCRVCADNNRQRKIKIKKQISSAKVDQRRHIAGRLPNGSTFVMGYDADKIEWHGSLMVPGLCTFEAIATSVLDLPKKLDVLYRNYLSEEKSRTKQN